MQLGQRRSDALALGEGIRVCLCRWVANSLRPDVAAQRRPDAQRCLR
jgi:hypothetical protein